MEEIEAKFLDVNIDDLEKKLAAFGATKVGETISHTTNFDYPDYRLKESKAWFRLRSEFGETTLAYKQRLGVTSDDASTQDAGMKEIEVSVGDFEKTKALLFAVGMIEKFTQGRKRIRWQKDEVEFDIDCWPLIPPYLEIEADSWEKIKAASESLGFDYDKHLRCSAHNVFMKYGFDEHDYSIFTLEKQVKKDLS